MRTPLNSAALNSLGRMAKMNFEGVLSNTARGRRQPAAAQLRPLRFSQDGTNRRTVCDVLAKSDPCSLNRNYYNIKQAGKTL